MFHVLFTPVQLMKKASASQLISNAPPTEQLRLALQQVPLNPFSVTLCDWSMCVRVCVCSHHAFVPYGSAVSLFEEMELSGKGSCFPQGVDLPVKELGLLMQLLGDKKRKAEQEEAETNMEILLEFLLHSRQQKQEELRKVRIL